MNAFRTLVLKDLREARASILVLGLLAVTLSVAGVLAADKTRLDTSSLGPLQTLVLLVVPMAALVFSHVVVTRELVGRTQLFLESLPVRRGMLFVAKLAVVLLAMFIVNLGLAAGLLVVHTADGLAPIFLARIMGFSACWSTFFFLVGFLGRYRLPLVILLLVGAAVLAAYKSFEVVRVVPFVLVDPTLVYESSSVPWRRLFEAFLMSGGFVGGAAFLVFVREGDLPARLGERMSQREKVFLAMSAVSLVFGWATLEQEEAKPPYILTEAAVVSTRHAYVAVGTGRDRGDAEDQRVARLIHDSLAQVHEQLGITLPRVIVVSSTELPRGVVEHGRLHGYDGVIFRMRPPTTQLETDSLITTAVHTAVAHATNERVLLEDRHFLLDGYSLLATRMTMVGGTGEEAWTRPLERDDDLVRRAVLAVPEGPSSDVIGKWDLVQERAGVDGASAFGWLGLRVLARDVGYARAVAFARGILGVVTPSDVRALWQTPDVDEVLMATCGITRDAWIASWRKSSDEARVRLASSLAATPRPDGELELQKLSALSWRGRVKLTTPLPPDSRVELQVTRFVLHRRALIEPEVREERSAEEMFAGAPLPFTFSSGERFAWRLVVVGDDDMRIPTPWHREEVP